MINTANDLFEQRISRRKRSLPISFDIEIETKPRSKKRKTEWNITNNTPKITNLCGHRLSLDKHLSNQEISNRLITGYIRKNIISIADIIPNDIHSICCNYFGLSRFISSSIINRSQTQILLKLLVRKLSRKTTLGNENNFVFKLLYRHSLNNNDEYQKLCDGKKSIIVLIKSNYNQIFGGYTSSFIYDKNNKYKYNKDTNSFLFKLGNSFQNSKIYDIKDNNSRFATINHPDGPSFGEYGDIHLNLNKTNYKTDSFCRNKTFCPDEDGLSLCGQDLSNFQPDLLDIPCHYFQIIDVEIYQIK